MPESMKNRGLYEIGTRVHIAQDKYKSKIGTVVEYSEDGERMWVHWDGDFLDYAHCEASWDNNEPCNCDNPLPRIVGPFMPMELKEVE